MCIRDSLFFIKSNFIVAQNCSAPEIPEYSENFLFWPPSCWLEGNEGMPTSGPANFDDSAWVTDGFGNIGSSGSARINISQTNLNNEWFISPEIDLTGGPYDLIFEIAVTNALDFNASNFGSDDKVQLVFTIDGGASWTILETWDNTSSVSNTGQTILYDLSPYLSLIHI